MTISLEWDEVRCRVVADLLLKAGQSQADLATEFGTDSLVRDLVTECRDRAGFYKGLAADVVGCLADLKDERGEDDLGEEDCGHPAGEPADDGQDPAGVDA